jgi:hypothetical protein
MFCPALRTEIIHLRKRAEKEITRWVVPGSRLFNEICGRAARRDKYRGAFLVRLKAAPLQTRLARSKSSRLLRF